MSHLTPDLDSYPADSMPTESSNIPEDGDLDLLMSSEDSTLTFSPPARIAARFYRPSSARRRSSAASSRRNSISSSHSHHSHHSQRSYHGPQSSNVAQHLRRASILESRKARLADRAAHAEKVRLRAAIAKAAPRPSGSEERALAAERTREIYLAQVAAACADEVKRAKRVAEDMKERREQEGKKLREDMEERLADAQRRRLIYQRNIRRPRTSSVTAAEEKRRNDARVVTLRPEDAARRIQRRWRRYQRQRLMQHFQSLGLSIDSVRNVSFEDAGVLLAQEDVLATTTSVLRLCFLREDDTADERAAVRTFLSAFVILAHPSQVLSHDGEQEKVHNPKSPPQTSQNFPDGLRDVQDLLAKCRDLLISFEELLAATVSSNDCTPPPTKLASLREAHTAFDIAFSAWKAHDSSVLVQTMVAQFVELDSIWQKIKDDTEETVKAEYKQGIHDNQIKLLVRIKRLVGAAAGTDMVKRAIRESRSRRNKQRAVERPRLADKPTSPAQSGQGLASAAAPAIVDSKIGTIQPQNIIPPNNSLQTGELTKVFSPLPDNRTLLHELAINKDYRIDAATTVNSPAKMATSHTVFSSMRREIQAGQGDGWIAAMAENVRGRLLRLLSPGNTLHVLITEALDPAVIARECRMGSFSYERFFSFMYSILPQLCAEFRDPEVKSLEADRSGDVIDRLARVMHVIDLLSLDFANYMLQSAAPILVKEAASYENTSFQQDLDSKAVTLRKTQAWWNKARESINAEANRRDPERVNLPANRPSLEKIYMHGLTDLFVSVSDLRPDDLPETLRLDRARVMRTRQDTLRIVFIGSILLSAKNLLKRDVRAQWKSEATRMWDVLRGSKHDPTIAPSIQAILESTHTFPPSAKVQLTKAIARTLAQQKELTDPVSKLLFHRLKSHVFARLSATSAGDRVRAASTASEGLASSGLPEFVTRIGALVDELGRIAEVDRSSHGRWYEGIARNTEVAV
ncbi:MAG: hypothetical protein M1825_006002 [Sarcosagium campestre]|nr:MAG: hypothetical protein M1825_006002 [Sarcosagium campestre]